jgi:hypothetical protein
MAMVLAREAKLPDLEAFERALEPTLHVELDHVGEAIWAFEIDGAPTNVALLPTPIPWSEIESPCATAWWWPEATDVCKPCPAHWIVTTEGDDVFAANLRLTKVIAALSASGPAAAVYWGAGAVIRSAEDFLEQAASATRDLLPLGLWVDLQLEPVDDDDFFFATIGMQALGHLEIETVVPRDLGEHALDRVFAVAHYLCDRGPVLSDGDTVGFIAGEKIRISHRPSRWDRPGPVLFLELDVERFTERGGLS